MCNYSVTALVLLFVSAFAVQLLFKPTVATKKKNTKKNTLSASPHYRPSSRLAPCRQQRSRLAPPAKSLISLLNRGRGRKIKSSWFLCSKHLRNFASPQPHPHQPPPTTSTFFSLPHHHPPKHVPQPGLLCRFTQTKIAAAWRTIWSTLAQAL